MLHQPGLRVCVYVCLGGRWGVTDGVQHEAVDTLACGDHHHGGAAVEGIARRHQVPARLQGIFLGGLVVRCLGRRGGWEGGVGG